MLIFFRCHKRLSICKRTALDLSVGSLFSSSMKEVLLLMHFIIATFTFILLLLITSLIVFVIITIKRYHYGMIHLTTGRARVITKSDRMQIPINLAANL